MNSKGRQMAEAIERELESWPDAAVEFSETGKHPKAKLSFGGKLLSVPFSSTASDPFAIRQALGDVRRTLRKLGACRSSPDPTAEEDEAPYRKPNDGAARRPSPVRGEPATPTPSIAEQLAEAGGVLARGGGMIADAVERAGRIVGRQAAQIIVDDPEADAAEEAERIRREEFEQRVAGIQDGIYFGLPADVYHAVPRLSSSGIQRLCVSPATFWRGSWFDPDRPDPDEDETIWQLLGRAYHVARLEPHLFEQTYVRELVKEEMPRGSLITQADMKKELEARGLKVSGAAGEQAERLLDDGFPAERLWHVVKAEWEQARGTRAAIPAKHHDQMITDRDRISQNGQIAPLLQGGEAEVSIFWTDEYGIQMKSRIDYLARDWWVDFKTFDNSRGKHVNQALSDAVRYNRYYVQAPVYREAIEQIRVESLPLIEAQTADQEALVAYLRMKPGELQCWYVFQEKGGIPNLLAREFPFYAVPYTTIFNEQITDDAQRRAAVRELTSKRTQLFQRGLGEILQAKKDFALYSEVYKDGDPWFPINAIGKFHDDDFHPYWLAGDIY